MTKLLLAFLLLSTNALIAQDYFAKYFTDSGHDYATGVITHDDGTYIIYGYLSSAGSGSTDLLVGKFDENGSIIWQKTYGGSYSETGKGGFEDASGNIYLCGTTYSCTNYYCPFVIKISSTGDLIWKKNYRGTSVSEYAFDFIETADGGGLIAGYTAAYTSLGYAAWLIKIDLNGDVLWDKIYGTSASENFNSVINTSDGGYIAAGYSSEGYRAGLIVKISSTGDVEWKKTVYDTDEDDWINEIIELSNGNYLVAGSGEISLSLNVSQWMYEISSSGQLLWQKQYLISGSYFTINKLFQKKDSSIVAIGYLGAGSRAIIANIAADGTPIIAQSFDYDSKTVFMNADTTNFGIIAVGYNQVGSDYHSPFMVHTRWDATISDSCDAFFTYDQTITDYTFPLIEGTASGIVSVTTSVVATQCLEITENDSYLTENVICRESALTNINLKKPVVNTWTFAPNPTNDILHIKLQNNAIMVLFDMYGRKIMTYDLPAGKSSINLRSLSTGLYYLTNSNYGQTQKLIIE